MGEIVAVLVVAAPGDPGELLAAGLFSAAPELRRWVVEPCVSDAEPYSGRWYWSGRHHDAEYDVAPYEVHRARRVEPDAIRLHRALPLWWDGAVVPEGWDRARRVYAAACLAIGHLETAAGAMAAVDPRDAEGAERMGHSLVGLGVAYPAHRTVTRVVRLARVDGRLVEVSDG